MQLSLAVVLQREQEEGGGDAVADAGLDGDSRLEVAEEAVEPKPLVVAVAARDAAGVVAVPSLSSALDGVPELGRTDLEVVDQGLDGGHRDGIVVTRMRLSSSGR